MSTNVKFSMDFDARYAFSKVMSSDDAPFNSGAWRFTYEPLAGEASVSCTDSTVTARVSPIELMTEHREMSGFQRRSDDGISDDQFPPTKDWVIGCSVASTSARYFWRAIFKASVVQGTTVARMNNFQRGPPQLTSQYGSIAKKNARKFSHPFT